MFIGAEAVSENYEAKEAAAYCSPRARGRQEHLVIARSESDEAIQNFNICSIFWIASLRSQ
jgi:hypothetical protein